MTVRNVLFLCTGNSARSILAEALLSRLGQGRYRAFSAGSHPKGKVNPFALELLRVEGYDVSRLASKSWEVFATADAPAMDLIVTVCDQAAEETCPVWPGRPATAHWGLPDPAAAPGDDAAIRAAFRAAYRTLEARIEAFVKLGLDGREPNAIHRMLDAVGAIDAPA